MRELEESNIEAREVEDIMEEGLTNVKYNRKLKKDHD